MEGTIMKFLDGFGEQAYALLRIVAGLLFLAHGVQKFFNFPTDFPMPLNPMLHAAGAIELVAGGLIALGLFPRPAAFIASGMAAVGYRSEEHTSELQSLMRISSAVFCLQKKHQ